MNIFKSVTDWVSTVFFYLRLFYKAFLESLLAFTGILFNVSIAIVHELDDKKVFFVYSILSATWFIAIYPNLLLGFMPIFIPPILLLMRYLLLGAIFVLIILIDYEELKAEEDRFGPFKNRMKANELSISE